MRKHFALISLILFSLGIYGQRLISGTVIDEDTNEVLIEASIIVNHTEIGTITDVEGHFSLLVPDSSYITFLYLGYNTKTISVQNLVNDTIIVGLVEDGYRISTDF